MWHVLTGAQQREAIRRGLPSDAVVSCGTLADHHVKCDAGLAFGPDGPLLPCVICKMEIDAKREEMAP